MPVETPIQVQSRYSHIERTQMMAIPIPFGPDRAEEIIRLAKAKAIHGPVSDQYDRVMTPGEIAYVIKCWKAHPSGATTFDSIFQDIRLGRQLYGV